MCIRDSIKTLHHLACEDRHPSDKGKWVGEIALVSLKGDIDNLGSLFQNCLLYTSDAADERSSVDLGGRRIIKKKKRITDGYTPEDKVQTVHRQHSSTSG